MRALGLYAALSLPMAALAHIGLETATSPDGFASIVTPRHGWLVLIVALILAAALRQAGLTGSASTRRRNAALLAAALPGRGKGAPFLALCVAVQFAFVLSTMLAEGTLPDITSAAAAFACAGLALGLASLLIWSRRIELVLAIVAVLHRAPPTHHDAMRCMRAVVVPHSYAASFALFRPNRPPPSVRRISTTRFSAL